jgi:hypothetical protein
MNAIEMCDICRPMGRSTLLAISLLAACNGSTAAPTDATAVDSPSTDKAANCASSFTSLLDSGFGRLDGIVRAVVPPGHPTCALPNSDHLVVQVDVGAVTYRIVVNVKSTGDVRLDEVDAALPAPAFGAGWHVGESLDYVTTLGVHTAAFTPHPMDELVAMITDQIEIGMPLSAYSSTSGGNSSTHLVHRNATNQDGALVLDPTGSPHWLLFAFANQTF